jgi:hypothetical protein
VTVESGGTFAPGDPNTITVASLTLNSGSNFDEEIGGTSRGTGGASGYDQTIVQNGGTIALGGATLNLSFVDNFTPAGGDVFSIINNESGRAVGGTFDDRPQGTVFWVDNLAWQISYTGGSNNQDVTITALPTSFTNVSTASALSADIKEIDLESQASGGNGTNYSITLASGVALTEAAQLDAVNLAGADTLTINGLGDTLNGAGAYNGFFVYSGNVTIEDLTVANAAAMGGTGGEGVLGGGGGAGLGGGLFVASAGDVTLSDVNETDMLMRNSNTGAFELFDISNNTIAVAGGMGQVGLEWSVSGITNVGTAAANGQLAQAMASYAPANGAAVTGTPAVEAAAPASSSSLFAASTPSTKPV